MHYHGVISKKYLTMVYEDFCKPEGRCRVLHATKGISMCRHGSTGETIFLIIYEPWVKTIDLEAVNVETASDPDHPNVPTLTINSTKQAHTGITMTKTIQKTECLRRLFVTYLNDQAPNGTYAR
ncbi:hypothetical protein EDB89DRAFT_2123586 [Lactarius sanguifluus]|nr:hypothetical protein EDB89DRAFT_2123586 [Lactarius sanguifluus]